jgi:hypothetical protein
MKLCENEKTFQIMELERIRNREKFKNKKKDKEEDKEKDFIEKIKINNSLDKKN